MGSFPQTRPTRANYGPVLEDDGQVEDPDEDLSADYWNPLCDDVAAMGQTTPKAIIYVDSTKAIIDALGIDKTLVTVTGGDATFVQLTLNVLLGISIYFATAVSNTSGKKIAGVDFTRGSNVINVRYDSTACDFSLVLY